VHYDPMIAKVIASAENRDLAIRRLTSALRAFPILGVRTNVPFLLRVLDHPRFLDGTMDTGFLDREGSSLAEPPRDIPEFIRAVVAYHNAQPAAQAAASGRLTAASWDPWNG